MFRGHNTYLCRIDSPVKQKVHAVASEKTGMLSQDSQVQKNIDNDIEFHY